MNIQEKLSSEEIPNNFIQNKSIKQLDKNQNLQNGFLHSFLIFDQEQFDFFAYQIHLMVTYKGLIYALNNLNGPSDNFLQQKFVNFPVISNTNIKKTLFFDLDETLIHQCDQDQRSQYVITIQTEQNQYNRIGINMRPFAKEILKILSQYYEIYIFTASTSRYAKEVIELLDPYSQTISGYLSRENCLSTKNGLYIKDLRIIQNRELQNMIIVDNCVHSFAFQIENGVPILAWNNNFLDRELIFLTQYLIEAATAKDVRDFNRERLKLFELGNLNNLF